MNTIDVIHDVAHSYPGGVEALAARMGKSGDTLRKKVLPTNDTHELTVKEPDFEALSDKEILDLFLDLQAQQGEWAREISKAMSNGEIDWDELVKIRKEYNEFITASAEVMNRLQSFMAVSEEARSNRKNK